MAIPGMSMEITVCGASGLSTTRSFCSRLAGRRGNACGAVRAEGFDISCLHREDRHGYKAGALDAGLKVAKGDFILIFEQVGQIGHDLLEGASLLAHSNHAHVKPAE